MRSVFIISDLHLGGDYPVPPEKRGFRLCTHADAIVRFVEERTKEIGKNGPSEIVLNGDTVDFLAERDLPAGGPHQAATWSSFTADPQAAVDKFKAIVCRDKAVFDVFGPFLAAGGRLTVLLGNHDVELSLPPVRRELRKALGVKAGHDFEFFEDGEAYIIGDALIEHGNRYDKWNQIDFDGLRRVRSLMSRRQAVPDQYQFAPPAGSEMVVSVINEIKRDYAFVDLLKPETSAAVPTLLALEPSYRKRFGRIARLWYWTRSHGLEGPILPKFGGDIRADNETTDQPFGHDIGATFNAAQDILGALDEAEALNGAIKDALGTDGADFLRLLQDEAPERGPAVPGTDVAFVDTLASALGFFKLLASGRAASIDKRMRALLSAMRGMQKTDTFDRTKETAKEYHEAAQALARDNIRYVAFGHTHLAKRVDLGEGRWYFNSGTWADVLQFPIEILTLPETKALAELRTFAEEMKAGDFSRWTIFRPTFIRFDVDDDKGKVARAQLCEVPIA
jgi:UDP-2,3-diacylglucosamine pyrophosphatase LpxH